MKIERNKKDMEALRGANLRGGHEVGRRPESNFEGDLNQQQEQMDQQKLMEILASLEKINTRLSGNLNINDLMLYKRMVRDFLKEATSRAYRIEQQRGRHRRGRALLVSIRTIDEEMEQLMKDFMDKKREPMDILEALDKIRGMLVDLMA